MNGGGGIFGLIGSMWLANYAIRRTGQFQAAQGPRRAVRMPSTGRYPAPRYSLPSSKIMGKIPQYRSPWAVSRDRRI
jgi:hypothetical protein